MATDYHKNRELTAYCSLVDELESCGKRLLTSPLFMPAAEACGCAATPVETGGPRWVLLDPGYPSQSTGHAPGPRSSHAMVVSGNKAYLLGGELQARIPVPSTVHCFDLETRHWEEFKTAGEEPTPRNACAAAALDGVIYVFGGRAGIDMGEGACNELYALHLDKRTWTKVAPANEAPPARSYHGMAALEDTLYVFGGCGIAGRLNDLWAFHVPSCSWRQLPSSASIAPRGGASLVALPQGGGTLYVAGGFCGHELADTHAFSVEAGAWQCGGWCCTGDVLEEDGKPRAAPGFAPARSVFGAAAHSCGGRCPHDGHVVAFGGEVDPSAAGHAGAGAFVADALCARLDGHEPDWHALQVAACAGGSPLEGAQQQEGAAVVGSVQPCARGWFACAQTPDGLLIHGGLTSGNQRLGDLWLLRMHL